MRKEILYTLLVAFVCAVYGGGICAQESVFADNVFANTNAATYTIYTPALSASQPICQPFSNTLPSDLTAEAKGIGHAAITNRRNGFITPGDVNQDPESPVGEPWVMLAFAGAAGVVIAVRQKRVKTL